MHSGGGVREDLAFLLAKDASGGDIYETKTAGAQGI